MTSMLCVTIILENITYMYYNDTGGEWWYYISICVYVYVYDIFFIYDMYMYMYMYTVYDISYNENDDMLFYYSVIPLA